MGRKVWCGIAAMAVALLAGAAPALADYGPSTPPSPRSLPSGPQVQVLPEVQTAPPPALSAPAVSAPTQVLGESVVPPQRAVSGSSLPFTGADVAGLTVIGVGLVGAGIGIRRAGRRHAAS